MELKFSKVVSFIVFSCSFISFVFGQTDPKTGTSSTTTPQTNTTSTVAPTPPDISNQPLAVDTAAETGISVSPSTLRFTVKPGGMQTKTIKVTNDTKKTLNFQIKFQDFGAGKDAKQSVNVEPESKNALSKYIVVSPTLVELKPREAKTISVILELPSGDAAAIAMWTTLILDQVIDRPKLQSQGSNDNKSLALGITAGVGFGVNIHQNPPNVVVNNVEILSLKYEKMTEKMPHSMYMKAKNTGDGIGYCLYYIELTNLITGKQSKLKVKQFGILPGYEKEFKFELPKDLEKGKYSALAVLDFGNKEELQTAELDFTIQ